MKKIMAIGVALLAMTTSVFAADVNVKVNDKAIDSKGVIVEGRTLVPVRGIFEELGYKVVFDPETKTAYLNRLGSTIKMTSGQDYFTLDDKKITPDVPQQIIDGRFMLPLRAVGEALDYNINWDAETKTASIAKKQGLVVLESVDLNNLPETVNDKK